MLCFPAMGVCALAYMRSGQLHPRELIATPDKASALAGRRTGGYQ